jgi:hypothetical protein
LAAYDKQPRKRGRNKTRAAGVWAAYDAGKEIRFESEKEMKDFITERFTALGIKPENIFFSEDKDKI